MRKSFIQTAFCMLAMLARSLGTKPIANADSPESVVLLPQQVELSHAGDLQRLSVATWQDGIAGSTIDDVTIESSDRASSKWWGQTLHAVSDGVATVTAHHDRRAGPSRRK
ncbi:hypothetical protein [Rhodopirellula europaea]|uniref:hypothetical protein n=1 Tax=Rhodopirellula europaea TaxID=1263866 RepID=UPI003D2D9B50